ncbi:cysteine hydrolase [Pikeienuella piscinae]|uniref:Cysteine hydrolase n=1 Tax=Pikeienuella piscinae TaxID=2748098 RepID=A0A7L5BTN6_9RHOB|nr:isochorismatase family cysteine hydrolase [Pikeienuella piscinae]QIE54995.1 cysteine hydrolase [Pikeienuella piscinae]
MAPKSRIAADLPGAERVLQPALIVVDMQNDFVREGAPLEVPDARATIPAIRSLIEAFRARSRPVMFTRFLSREEENLLWLWSPQCRPDTKCCWPGHRRAYADAEAPRGAADVIDELPVEPGDAVIDKFGYGAFHGTDLDARLRDAAVSSLVVTGTVTQICVEETAREAFHHGYRTVMVRDGVSSFAPDLHAATLKNFAMKYGWVATAEEVVSWL